MKRQNEVLVGFLTIVSVAILIAGTYWLSRGSFRGGYNVYTITDWGAGLKTGQRVLFAGVSIGFVDDVELKREGKLVIKMTIEREDSIPLGSTASVQASGLFGDMVIAINPPGPGTQFHVAGDTLPPGKPGITPGDIMASADSTAKSLQAILGGVKQQLVDAGTIAELRNTILSASKLVGQFSTVVATQSAELSATTASLRRAVSSIDSARIDSTLRNLQRSTRNMEDFTASLQRTGTQLSGVMAKLESSDGTAGKLLNDPAVYNELRSAVTDLRALLADFQTNPRKYMDFSFSIFGGRRRM